MPSMPLDALAPDQRAVVQLVLQREQQEAQRKRIEAKGVSDFQTIVSQSIRSTRSACWATHS